MSVRDAMSFDGGIGLVFELLDQSEESAGADLEWLQPGQLLPAAMATPTSRRFDVSFGRGHKNSRANSKPLEKRNDTQTHTSPSIN